ncbi:MAG: glycosyltransferase [Acidobacteria bacterium]|nr:glycosyltransferase [Acidobacteriota bacterium]
MKILFLGWLDEGQTSRMRMEVLRELGHTVIPLNCQDIWRCSSWASRHFQQRLNNGPAINRLNSSLFQLAREHKPDLLWAEKQEHIRPEVLNQLRNRGIRLLHYTPDPYFTLDWKRSKLMDACLPLFDYVVTSKQYELGEYREVCQKVIYIPLGYDEGAHRPISPPNLNAWQIFNSDVTFVGGWEPRRQLLLEAIARLDCNLKIWGYGWDHVADGKWTPRRAFRLRRLAGQGSFHITKSDFLAKALQGGEVYGDQYAWALTGARINVGFLRQVWPDQHTTRTFEIPACRSMLLADRTDEHLEFFAEGKEAEFFSSQEELQDKARFYLSHESLREKIAWNGYHRCLNSNYSYKHRVRSIMNQLN